MGTSWSVRFALPRGGDAAALGRAIEARLDGIVAEMSHWAAESLLSRFNRAPAGMWMALPADFAWVMARGLAIAAASGGAFDPAIGQLTDLWGFGPHGARPTPLGAEVAAARTLSGWQQLAWDGAARRLRQAGGVALDLSGIAKGFAVDAVAALLTERGIGHALVEIGGELVGRGVRPDGEPWWVDLETPPGLTLAPIRIALHELAVATSGDYRRGAHTLDPRTGRPALNGVVSVSVLHAQALDADAWATAIAVLGAEEGMALAVRERLAARVVMADGTEHLSPLLTAMLAD
ncbi:FAD:protein FMN transferase [Sphingomonas jatrophae]|nr:FAD:protein FMN transferase [Sphingomonas jatrophae]